MSLESAIYSTLTAHGGVSGFVGDRVYPRQIPQDKQLPAIAYLRVSSRDLSTLDSGDNCTESVRLQLDIVSTSYEEARDISREVRDAMNNASAFSSVKQQDKDMPGQNPDYHRVMLEFNVWYKQEV